MYASFIYLALNKVYGLSFLLPTVVYGYDPDVCRKDAAGAWIKRSEYGDRSSKASYGWEADRIVPLSSGSPDVLENLQPLQWANNVTKGDDYPNWKPAVTSDGNRNIELR